MKRNSFGENVIMFLLVIGVFAIIGVISNSSESECIEYGCSNRVARLWYWIRKRIYI